MSEAEVVYYAGPEVRTTAANGSKTLYVVGVRSIPQMIEVAQENNCKHICLGAKNSFQNNKLWGEIVPALLTEGFWVTLEYPTESQNFVVETIDPTFVAHPKFVPLVKCSITYVETLNRNLTLMIDDGGETNTGVWSIPQSELLDRNRYTPWVDYENEEVIMTDEDLKEFRKNARRKSKEQ